MRCLPVDQVSNPPSFHNARRLDFVEWDRPVAGMTDPCRCCPKQAQIRALGRRCCSTFLILSGDAHATIARRVAEWPRILHLHHRHDPDRHLEVHVAVTFDNATVHAMARVA